MKNNSQFIIGFVLALAILLSACGNNVPAVATTSPTITNTPDPCAPENIEAEAMKVQKYMREFDDASSLAPSGTREEIRASIADLQRIRREAEDQFIPPCLGDLKAYQISHMNTVINTLIAFVSGLDQQAVDQGIKLAREQHDQYLIELARLLGQTIQPVTVVPLNTAVPTPAP